MRAQAYEGIAMGNVIPLDRHEDGERQSNPALRRALALMKEALAILDAGGAGVTTLACHLSLAIDRAEENPGPRTEEECQAMLDGMTASAAGAYTAGKI